MGPYLAKSNKQIDEVVALVRGSLSKMARITLEALIVIDVHGNVMMCILAIKGNFMSCYWKTILHTQKLHGDLIYVEKRRYQ